jgi:hypothetical protein
MACTITNGRKLEWEALGEAEAVIGRATDSEKDKAIVDTTKALKKRSRARELVHI